MEVDREIVALAPQSPAEHEIPEEPWNAASPRYYDDFVEVRVGGDDWSGRGLDEVGEVRVGKPLAQGGHGRRRENHVAYLPETNQQDLQGSMLASSMSMTGMSSLIG